MKILGISCSQRPESNASKLLGYVLDRLKDHETTMISLQQIRIDCMGCEECLTYIHAHDDDLAKAEEQLQACDVLILSTPTCYGMPPAIGKAFLDRSDPYWGDQRLKGKHGAVIVNGGSMNERITDCANAVRGYFDAHGIQCLAHRPCFANSERYPSLRIPIPLSPEYTAGLDALVEEIRALGR